ncbi:MAG: cytochrome d ubiquinol oxidase subunit II [Gaiellaceae bacterium]
MHLYDIPLIFVLAGLVFYAVLGGADFGAGFWQLTAGKGPHAQSIRDHAHHAIAPVWEANHVWLVFVLTVTWTAYPTAFGAIASTLSVPLFIAGLGIIFRGATYALRAGAAGLREQRVVDTVFSVSSILAPFALGTVVGAIAARRVPVGNAAGDQFSSWLNGTAVLTGVLAVAISAYMAAVFLCADAVRLGELELEAQFRKRALASAVIAGAIVLAGLPVVRSQAHPLFHGLVHGKGLAALVVSVIAGICTFGLVLRRRYEPARYSAAVAVGAVVAGWALAQSPTILPGLTIKEAAAAHDTLVAIIVSVLAGGAILFPSLALLFKLVLGGRLDEHEPPRTLSARDLVGVSAPRLLTRVAAACLIAGLGFTTVADAAWAHAIGATCLLAFVAFAFPAALPPDILGEPSAARTEGEGQSL